MSEEKADELSNKSLLAKIIALEGAIAYTATACTIQNPEVRNMIVNSMVRDASIQAEEVSKSTIRLAQLIHSLKHTATE